MEIFRVVTLNLMGMGEPIERRMELIGRGLADLSVDAVALQEVCEHEGRLPNQAAALAERLGYQHLWARAKGEADGVQEGLAVLSRHPIREHRVWPLPSAEGGRIVLQVVLESPVGPLGLFNTHLDHHPDNGVMREQQVVALTDIVRAQVRELPALIAGDFNATPEHDEIRFLRGRHTLEGRRAYLHDAYARVHPIEDASGETWAKRNPLTRRWRWLENDRRMDFIFVSSIESNGRGEVRSCRVVLDQPDDLGQFPSDHFAVMADVQLSPSPGC
ncbi:endonuclease/exonuclease/phosphatase family protein [Hyalangium sp.]|uniref:endonuclease/exonuclease/phosphatase family protein n=1 Tax=Hyalangium sp. TaxID=2028555 RepID=UPI002D4F86B0|nr:endonuclease/exonuclease/phosphatase family protein [Hyalangium sp.]HYH99201.1 endonuclease/exonuclease/phosphatase family protein [Hyalangium sp.]